MGEACALITEATDQWLLSEEDTFEKDKTKIKGRKAKGPRIPLWAESYKLVDEIVREYGLSEISSEHFKSGVMSVQSSIGTSSERLLASHGHAAVKAKLIAGFATTAEFQNAIAELRKLSSPELIATTAEDFFVRESYVRDLVHDQSRAVIYPDTASLLLPDNGIQRVVIAEHKLTGDNDIKAIPKNLELLESMRGVFQTPGREVKTAVALPFTDSQKAIAKKWIDAEPSADMVICNRLVWWRLMRMRISPQDYRYSRRRLAEFAAHRIVQWMAPATFILDPKTLTWSWVDDTTVVAPTGDDVEAGQATLDLLEE